MDMKFYWVDVFASAPLEGNPLSVVLDADALDEATMKRIAGEFNQAETTFILKPTRPGATYRLRSFTAPGTEVFGAGHNALGAWWLLAAGGFVQPGKDGGTRTTFQQEIGDEVLPVDVTYDAGKVQRIVMKHSVPAFGATLIETRALAEALGIEDDDIDVRRLPPQVVSTGAGHFLVPLRERRIVDRVRPDSEKLRSVLRQVGGEGCYVFALDPVDSTSTAYARFFNPTAGIVEDSATGTAAGPLAAQLVARTIVADGSVVIIEQGYAMGRPSKLEISVKGTDVRLAGRGVIAAEGVLHL
ncbi:PhzF family phenazine biosynthesis protein [Pendulispora rubella]|uniref:PhzF family phenazine biosynthesis protein n=1 Tax=Pendulispora rubella TaxID=2741070 RepID=A0ABZ2L6F5_9BACT